MKKLENKTTSIKISEDKFLKYSDLLGTVINKPVREGLSVKELKRDIAILNIAEDATDIMEFSDEQYSYIKEEVENSKWTLRHQDIIDFVEYVSEA